MFDEDGDVAVSGVDSKPTVAEVNSLRHRVAELKEQLSTERQNNASLTSEKRQTEKKLQVFTSPTKKKPEDVAPKQSIQTASERKAEIQYLRRRKDGLVEQMQNRKILESERVQTSRRTTRSQTRSAKLK